MPVKEAEKEDEAESEPNRIARKKEATKAPSSQPVEYYLKHRINEKLIEGLVDNHRKKITRKEGIRGNFEIPCNIGGLKHMNALVDQGSGVNIMPLSTYMKLTDERPAETIIRLSVASHSYIYPLGMAEDILVEVAEHVYPVDFMILDIKEEEKDSLENIMSTLPHRLIHQFQLLLKKPSNSIHSSNRSGWFLNHPTPSEGEPEEEGRSTTEGVGVEYFDIVPTRSELAYHKNFTYIVDFMSVEDISSIIDPRLSQVVLGKPFVEISNMTHDPPKGVLRFINGTDEVAYKIEQYNSLSDLEKEHTKSVNPRNKEDKRRGVEYVMSKILGFYKECLELGPEYVTGMNDEGEVT
ncbi:retrotransposon ORF1 [Tanacetum coccineum]